MSRRRRKSADEAIGALLILLIMGVLFFPRLWPWSIILIILAVVALFLFRIKVAVDKRRRLLFATNLQRLTPGEFERYVRALFEGMGYKPQPQGSVYSSDQGIDLKAWKDGEYAIVQCKRFTGTNRVGVKDVRDLMGVVAKENADRGYLVTSSNFTTEAWNWAKDANKLVLVTPKKIDDWLRLYKIGPYQEEAITPEPGSKPDDISKYAPPHLRTEYERTERGIKRQSESYQSVIVQQKGFEGWQVLVIVVLSIIAFSVCSCVALAGLGVIAGPPTG